jgi:hypothetical protein
MANSFMVRSTSERKEIEFKHLARSSEQFETVRKIVEDPAFDFTCFSSNIFSSDVVGYSGPFNFLWFDKSGILHVARIYKSGKIKRHLKDGEDIAC